MHPELEDFLEDAFGKVKQSESRIGRVVVEPDYDITPEKSDGPQLARELQDCLRGAKEPGQVAIDQQHALLRKYLRGITLHPEPVEGPWVEVAPPGNWI